MLEVASEKLTERERECLKHFRQARESGVSFAEYCHSSGLNASEWHAVRHGMVVKGLMPPGQSGGPKRSRPGRSERDSYRYAWSPPELRWPVLPQRVGYVTHQVV
jgi:hypothetical protein